MGGSRRLPLFLICFVPLVGMSLYYLATNGTLTAAFLIPLATTVLVGIAEETMFRRVLYVGLRREYGGQDSNKPLLIAALMFSLLHAVNIFAGAGVQAVLVQLVLTFIAGLYFALMYERTQSIVLLMALHALWDFLLVSDATRAVPAIAIGMGVLQLVQIASVLALLRRRMKPARLAGECS